MAADNVKKINLLENGEFVSKEITSTKVGDLRNELDIPSGANVMVEGTIRTDEFELEDGFVVAYASNNKVGGVTMVKFRVTLK